MKFISALTLIWINIFYSVEVLAQCTSSIFFCELNRYVYDNQLFDPDSVFVFKDSINNKKTTLRIMDCYGTADYQIRNFLTDSLIEVGVYLKNEGLFSGYRLVTSNDPPYLEEKLKFTYYKPHILKKQ